MSTYLPIKIAMALAVGVGLVLQGVVKMRLYFLRSGFIITKMLGLWEIKKQGRECVSTPEACPCLSSAGPPPPAGEMDVVRPLPAPFNLR